jgi:hypothetical protein
LAEVDACNLREGRIKSSKGKDVVDAPHCDQDSPAANKCSKSVGSDPQLLIQALMTLLHAKLQYDLLSCTKPPDTVIQSASSNEVRVTEATSIL